MFPSLNFPSLSSAIGRFEGWNPNDQTITRAERNNNPGNLMYTPWSASHGATGADYSGFAVFPNAQSGWMATDALIGVYAQQGYTLAGMLDKWNPPTAFGNSPTVNRNYLDFLTQQTGIKPDQKLSEVQSGTTLTGWSIPDVVGGALGNVFGSIPGLGELAGLGNIFGTVGKIVPESINPFASFSWGRVAAFILGMIFIAAGLYSFRPVQTVVNQAAKDGAVALAAA